MFGLSFIVKKIKLSFESIVVLVILFLSVQTFAGLLYHPFCVDFRDIHGIEIHSISKSGSSYIWSPNGSLLGTRIEFPGEAVQASSLPTDLDADSGEDISLLTRGETKNP